ncbi:MAG: ABC transporter permease [Pseudomonadota bacterium]
MSSIAADTALKSAKPTARRFRLPSFTWIEPLILPLLIAGIWEGAAKWGWIDDLLLPPPSAVAEEIAYLWSNQDLDLHIQATVWRVAVGFAAGALVATILGAITGYAERAFRAIDPTIQALRSIPSIAWVPLFILWFGIFEAPKVLLIAVGAFFPIYLGLSTAIHGADRKLVEVGRVYRLSAAAMITRILLPSALPAYLTGLRNGLALGWMFVVAAEFMGASEGLGYLLIDGQMTGRAQTIIASIFLFACLGKASDWLLAGLSKPLLSWQDDFQSTRN